MKLRHLIISFCLVLGACAENDPIFADDVQHQFYLSSDKAILPIFVEGNTNSDVIMIVCHGGPGGTGLTYREWQVFDAIEDQYAVVYWDQRCAGNAQGNCNPNALSVETHTADLDKLVQLISQRYGEDKSIFLLGHSWGGALILSYLSSNDVSSQIKGGIVADGIHDFTVYISHVQDMISSVGVRQIALDNNADEWDEQITQSLSWTNSSDEDVYIANKAAYECQTLINKSDSISLPDVDINILLASTITSDQNFLMSLINQRITGSFMFEEIANLNISSQLSNITVPLALYWGKYDFVVPPIYANLISDLVSSTEQEMFIFEQSDHSPMFSEKSLFNAKTLGFIEKYK